MGIVEELESAIDIVDLVSKYSKIKKAGTNYKGLCPFPGHSEKTASFMVSPAKQIAYCFGCHRGGGPLKFVMDIENAEFKEALEMLGNITGKEVNNNFDKEKYALQKNLFSLYKDASTYYKEALKRYPEVKKYLIDRGINQESIDNFHLGYADSGVELYNYLKGKGYNEKQILDSNIFVDIRSRKDKFINRAMFPIQNARGDFVGFTARILGKGEPKYLNSPASNIYDKSSILYGLYSARHSITSKDYVIITEGNADAITLHQFGFTNSVAVSGTALTDKQLILLKRLTKKIYLCFDNDKAGHNATKQSLEHMKNNDFEVKIIVLIGGKDPDEILQNHGAEAFEQLIKNAVSPIGYYIQNSKFDSNSIDEKKNLLTELILIIKSYSDNIEKDFYLKEIAKLLDINQNIIYDMFNRTRFKVESKDETLKKPKPLSSEEIAIGYILYDNKYSKILQEKLLFSEFVNKDLQGVMEQGNDYINQLEIEKKERFKAISFQIEEQQKSHTTENIEAQIQKLLDGINRDIYKKVSADLKIKMNNGDNEAFKKYTELVQKAKRGMK